MDMKVDTDLIKQLRQQRAWSQEELAVATGLSLRTVQRIESEGSASLESQKAIAGAFNIESSQLEDRRASLAQASNANARQARNGMAGAIAGGLAAYAAITYSLVGGGPSSGEAGVYYAGIAAFTGACCALIDCAAKRRHRMRS